MKLLIYSDLHLEFGDWTLPADADADVLVLAGDIISFVNFSPLRRFLYDWAKPVLYVAGNHEYYTKLPMDTSEASFAFWLNVNCPNVSLLSDKPISLDGVNFFGGTMWTWFADSDWNAMHDAKYAMSDFQLIRNADGTKFTPHRSVELHEKFVARLHDWFDEPLAGPRVVISHHAPVRYSKTKYRNGPLEPAFNSLDMVPVIETRQPDLWIYGHTHENDDQTIRRTRVVTNQRGYPAGDGKFECRDFQPEGLMVIV